VTRNRTEGKKINTAITGAPAGRLTKKVFKRIRKFKPPAVEQ